MKWVFLLAVAFFLPNTALTQESPKPTLVSREGCKIIDADKKQLSSTWEQPEFGSIDEIKNCTTVYVLTSDLDDRKKIVKELEKDSSLKVVGTAQEAEFMITFQVGGYTTGASVIGRTVTRDSAQVGKFMVILRGQVDDKGARHQRIVWSDTETRNFSAGITFSKHPLTNSMSHFLSDLRKVRGQQKRGVEK